MTKREQQVLEILAAHRGRDISVQQIARDLAARYEVHASPDSIHRTAVSLQRRGLVLMYGAARMVRTYQITSPRT